MFLLKKAIYFDKEARNTGLPVNRPVQIRSFLFSGIYDMDTWTYLCAASGSALRCERLALRGAGLSAGEELKMLSESSRGASGLVLKKRAGGTSTNHTDQREKSKN